MAQNKDGTNLKTNERHETANKQNAHWGQTPKEMDLKWVTRGNNLQYTRNQKWYVFQQQFQDITPCCEARKRMVALDTNTIMSPNDHTAVSHSHIHTNAQCGNMEPKRFHWYPFVMFVPSLFECPASQYHYIWWLVQGDSGADMKSVRYLEARVETPPVHLQCWLKKQFHNKIYKHWNIRKLNLGEHGP